MDLSSFSKTKIGNRDAMILLVWAGLRPLLPKPIRPIRKPPTRNPNRNRRRQRPPQRQSHVRNQPQQRECGPKDLLLPPSILAPHHHGLTHDVIPATGAAFAVRFYVS